jgi:hypothetical protein
MALLQPCATGAGSVWPTCCSGHALTGMLLCRPGLSGTELSCVTAASIGVHSACRYNGTCHLFALLTAARRGVASNDLPVVP